MRSFFSLIERRDAASGTDGWIRSLVSEEIREISWYIRKVDNYRARGPVRHANSLLSLVSLVSHDLIAGPVRHANCTLAYFNVLNSG